MDAFEAGLWLYFSLDSEVVAVPRPVMHLSGERLHCVDGPAVHWPGGAAYFFWQGVQVDPRLILHPDTITVPQIHGERNVEIRRCMVERYGPARFLQDAGAAIVSRDACGVLYQFPLEDDEPLTMVQVVNSTPEPDGPAKTYMLRVPPTMRTARQAVAWTFSMAPDRYKPSVET